jgi:CO/xanthine dehydrogenase FAD-binding subunit
MKIFRPEEYVFATSVDRLITLLKEQKDRALIIAGGTSIHELGSHGLLEGTKTLVDITKMNLSYVRTEADSINIGATTTFAELLNASESRFGPELAVLVEALRSIRPVQVRNVATIGGSICCSLPFFDLPTALVALEAKVRVVGPSGERVIPIEDFFVDIFLTDLKPGEFVSEVQIPKPSARTSGAFRKLETNSVDWALVNVAVQLGKQGNEMRNVRVALGGAVGRKVMRARTVEGLLESQRASQENINKASQAVVKDVKPEDDFRASSEYRSELLKVYVRRCLESALSRMK